MSEAFKATRGKIAIKRTDSSPKNEGSIIYEQDESPKFKTGTVFSIGEPKIEKNGTSIPCPVKVGDHVLYTLEHGFVSVAGFDMIQQIGLIGLCDEGTSVQ